MSFLAVIHYQGATKRSRSVVASLVADLLDEGHSLSVLDISHYNTIKQDFPPRWVTRILGRKVRPQRFQHLLAELGAELHKPVSHNQGGDGPPAHRWQECLEAIDSELLTYFRVSSLTPETASISRMRKRLISNALDTYAALGEWLDSHQPEQLIIPNGRTSRQKIARVAAEERNISVTFYENGRAQKNSYYLGQTQPHDRLASQAEVLNLTADLDPTEISCLATAWLEERTNPDSDTNSFSKSWNTSDAREQHPSKKPLAVFFPSSTDEFLAFGPMWNIDGWESQFQAFDLMMTILEKKNCDLVLRLHPSLGEKSRQYFLQTVQGIRTLQAQHPTLTVHWHNSPVNSYGLVKSADYVIVEHSTIGLEANLMGKPVWINQAAQWDLVADVRQVLTPEDISEDLFELWSPNVSQAERFVAYWMMQEHPLRYSWSEWASYDPDSPPLLMKFATLLSPNPWSHRLQLVRIALTTALNNRFTG